MSIKIYDGLAYVGAYDPFLAADHIRATLERLFFDRFEELLHDPNAEANNHRELHDTVTRLHHSREWTLDPADIGYDVTLLNGTDKVLVLVTGEKGARYGEALIDAGVCIDYSYWNNADPAPECTDAQWQRRHLDWGMALSKDGEMFKAAPAEVGLSIAHPGRLVTSLEMIRRSRNRGTQ